MNILIVDDHPENLLALEAVLETPEYHLVRARSGMEALRLLLKEDFSLILLDVFMPGLTGFETAAMIRERPKTRNIPIIFVTAVNKSEEDIAKGYSVGAVDYIIKPFNPDVLKEKVAALAGLNKQKSAGPEGAAPSPAAPMEEALRVRGEPTVDQQRYGSLANAIHQILWIARPDGEIDFFNQAWFNYTGLTFEQSEGWGWKRTIYSEDVQSVMERWAEALRYEKEYQIECRLKRADGVYCWHLIRAFPDRDPQGCILAWLGTFTDIHDQKQVQERLQQINEELEQKKKEAETATRLKSEFVANVSHELRTPLNAVIGYTALLLEGNYGQIAEEQKNPVERIKDNASALLELITYLLDLSKLESGKIPIEIQPVNLKSLLPEAFKNITYLVEGKKIEIIWKIQDGLKTIQSDSLKVKQIFINLLTNAVKFTDRGSITISALNAQSGILLSIQDTGIGIKEKDFSVIFDAFRQIDGSITREVGGTGLGLTLVKSLLETLQGKIEVQSKLGKGSTFTAFFPDHIAPSSSKRDPADKPFHIGGL